MIRFALAAAACLALPACGTATKISEIGSPPAMTPSSDPTAAPGWRPLHLPMPPTDLGQPDANALWRPGSRAFFRDQRAAQLGDIVTVLINISDLADFKDSTSATRGGHESLGLPNLFGVENSLPRVISKANPAALLSTASSNDATGTGQIKRNEVVALRLAGIVTQVLPNGNLVVAARQQVRVNDELRNVEVSGIVRPQDIASDNTVLHDRMAEARISYGGRGQLTTVQSPRYGQQLLDILLPF